MTTGRCERCRRKIDLKAVHSYRRRRSAPVCNDCLSKSFEAATCEGKKRWPTEAAADFVAGIARAKGDAEMSYYHCRFCDGYHVGRPMKRGVPE